MFNATRGAICSASAAMSARRSWFVFFLGVALVFLGSGYYHYAPNDDSLVWDRLPMTVAFIDGNCGVETGCSVRIAGGEHLQKCLVE